MKPTKYHMKKFILNNIWSIIGGLFGGLFGYFYWRDIGCATGTCPITSKPLNSIIYFAVMGYFMIDTISQWRTFKEEKIH